MTSTHNRVTLDIHIPGYGPLNLKHLVLDSNGTLAFDGRLHFGQLTSQITRENMVTRSIFLFLLIARHGGNDVFPHEQALEIEVLQQIGRRVAHDGGIGDDAVELGDGAMHH